jgi:cytoskeletal protein CcmA (bactofilin family)
MEKNIPGVLLVGGGVVMRGSIKVPETIITTGKIEGEIEAQTIFVEEGGFIRGQINASVLDIAGVAKDNLTAHGSLIVRATGKVDGSITYSDLSLERGGQVSGVLNVQKSPEIIMDEAEFVDSGD